MSRTLRGGSPKSRGHGIYHVRRVNDPRRETPPSGGGGLWQLIMVIILVFFVMKGCS